MFHWLPPGSRAHLALFFLPCFALRFPESADHLGPDQFALLNPYPPSIRSAPVPFLPCSAQTSTSPEIAGVLPRDCRPPQTLFRFRNLRLMRIRCWVVISSSNTGPRPHRAVIYSVAAMRSGIQKRSRGNPKLETRVVYLIRAMEEFRGKWRWGFWRISCVGVALIRFLVVSLWFYHQHNDEVLCWDDLFPLVSIVKQSGASLLYNKASPHKFKYLSNFHIIPFNKNE